MKNAPDYAKYSERPHNPNEEENRRKKEHHGRMIYNNCEVFPDEYTSKEEN